MVSICSYWRLSILASSNTAIHILDAIPHTRLRQLCLQVLDVRVDEIVIVLHIRHVAAGILCHPRLRHRLAHVTDEGQTAPFRLR